MNDFTFNQDNPKHSFVFTGKGWAYFVICLVNFFLCTITLGVYTPWALVKCRRYVYQNMMLNGQPFKYEATGGAIFISFLLLAVIYIVSMNFILHGNPLLGVTLLCLLTISFPAMVVKSLEYHAMMTSLNGIRFGFECSTLKAWITILVVPVLLTLVTLLVVYILWLATDWLDDISLAFRVIFVTLVGIAGMGITYGITWGKWMQLVGNGGNFGIHRFEINVSLKACIAGSLKSLLTFLPFAIVIVYLISPIFLQMMMLTMWGGLDDSFVLEHHTRIMACYFLYFAGIIVVSSYLYVTLRNLFINNLVLDKGKVRFHTSVTVYGMVLHYLALVFISGLTLGLAYPWMKMWLVAWLAKNSHVHGDLDSLELSNNDKALKTNPAMWISRGVMTYFPFI